MANCTRNDAMRDTVVEEIRAHKPAVTFTDLSRSIEADESEVLKAIETLLRDNELDADMLLWPHDEVK